eukprot:sb/3472975/
MTLAGADTLRYLEQNSQITTVDFYTDSSVVIQRLAQVQTNFRSTIALKNTINKVAKLRPTTISWCKAHCGIEGNERADELAKEAAAVDFPDPESYRISLSAMKKHAATKTQENTAKYMEELHNRLKTTNKLNNWVIPITIDAELQRNPFNTGYQFHRQ